MRAIYTDDELITAWQKYRSPSKVAKIFNVSLRGLMERRRKIEASRNIKLSVDPKVEISPSRGRSTLDIAGGVILVFSDAHYWPGEPPVAHKALVSLARSLKPLAIVANGDILDGATISRHEPNGWESPPTLAQEIEVVQDRLEEIQKAAPKACKLLRTIGNHDIRFERKLATQVPEYRHLSGTSLKDHLPAWGASWSIMVNGHTMIKHKYNNGLHAAYNNTLRAGTSIVTGHLHRLLVTRWADYNGTRYGVDTGMLADIDSEQFAYAEDNPRPWGSGFAVLTFDEDGMLLPPELCEVVSGVAYFRGRAVPTDSLFQQPSQGGQEPATHSVAA
jgi:hypothetical protein